MNTVECPPLTRWTECIICAGIGLAWATWSSRWSTRSRRSTPCSSCSCYSFSSLRCWGCKFLARNSRPMSHGVHSTRSISRVWPSFRLDSAHKLTNTYTALTNSLTHTALTNSLTHTHTLTRTLYCKLCEFFAAYSKFFFLAGFFFHGNCSKTAHFL